MDDSIWIDSPRLAKFIERDRALMCEQGRIAGLREAAEHLEAMADGYRRLKERRLAENCDGIAASFRDRIASLSTQDK